MQIKVNFAIYILERIDFTIIVNKLSS